MARAVILKEVSSVFKAYQIGVDIRHLELIADYMVWLINPLYFMRIELKLVSDF
jgi:hypothetical protein